MSSRKVVLAVLLCLTAALPACGFAPLYGQKTQDALARNDVEVDNIPDRDGQYLRNYLIDRLYSSGRPGASAYLLKFGPIATTTTNLGIQRDATETRAELDLSVTMELVDKKTGQTVLKRDIKNSGGYNLLDNQLSALTSRQNTTESILRALGDQVVTELTLYFNRAGN